MQSYLQLENVGMAYNDGRGKKSVVLHAVDLCVERGEFVALIGHSGCGKSTLLNLIAGLQVASQGVMLCGGREIAGPGPDRGVVFQNHALLPWMSSYDNVYLAVESVFGGQESRTALKARAYAALAQVELTDAAHKRPHEISGGMKQRVGIARALAMEPKVLLLDEPFGALDALTRGHLQDVLMDLHDRLGTTVIMVTHDVDEAVLLSDRVVMMSNGPGARVAQVLNVDIARPRRRLELASQADYNRYRADVLAFLYRNQIHAA